MNIRNFLKKGKNRIIIVLPLQKIKIIAAVIVLIGLFALIQAVAFDMDLDCEKATHICTVSKKNVIEPTPIIIRRFDTARIYDMSVAQRITDNNKKIYDILINYGADFGSAYMDYGFTSQIKTNTLRVRLANYIETNATELHFSKRCYLNEYFCF